MPIRALFFRGSRQHELLKGNYSHGPQYVLRVLQCFKGSVEPVKTQGFQNPVGIDIYARSFSKRMCVQSNMGVRYHAIVMPNANIDAKLKAVGSADFRTAGQQCMTHSTTVFVGGSKPWENRMQECAKWFNVNVGIEPGANLGSVISKQAGLSLIGSRASFAGGLNVYGKAGIQCYSHQVRCYSSMEKRAMMDKRNIQDHKRRLLAAKYELKRVLYKAVLRDPNLPRDLWVKFRTKLSKLPRNSSFVRVRNRCIFSGRPRAVYRKFRMSRIVFRELASKGELMGVRKASW